MGKVFTLLDWIIGCDTPCPIFMLGEKLMANAGPKLLANDTGYL